VRPGRRTGEDKGNCALNQSSRVVPFALLDSDLGSFDQASLLAAILADVANQTAQPVCMGWESPPVTVLEEVVISKVTGETIVETVPDVITPSSTNDDDARTVNGWVIVLIVLLCLLICLVLPMIMIYFLWKKQVKPVKEEEQVEQVEPVEQAEPVEFPVPVGLEMRFPPSSWVEEPLAYPAADDDDTHI